MATILNKQDEDVVGDRSGVNAPGPLQTVGSAVPAVGGGAMATPEKRPQGSGRFTNLQKYIQANQGAGQEIAGQVGKGVREEIGKEEKEAGEYYKNLGSAISGANKVAKEGHKYQQTLQDIGKNVAAGGYKKDAGTVAKQREGQNFGIQEFTQDPGFEQFQNIQAGRGIDEKLLGLRQQQAARESGQYLDAAQGAEKALGSESGRFNLLRKTFGGEARPGYSTGQQRLDQALLSQSGLGGLRQQVGGDVRSATEQNRLATQASGDVGRLATQEQGLIGSISDQNLANEQAYKQMLESYIDPTNAARQADWESLQNSMKAYDTSYQGKIPMSRGLNQEQLNRLGVEGQKREFNALDNLTASDIATQGRQAQSYRDVASQGDVDKYKALAQIMGRTDTERDANLGQAGDLGQSYGAIAGDKNLTNRLSAAQSIFDENAANTDFKSKQEIWREVTANAKDLLDNGDSALGFRDKEVVGNFREINTKNINEQFQQWLADQGYNDMIGQAPSTGAKDQYVTPAPTNTVRYKK